VLVALDCVVVDNNDDNDDIAETVDDKTVLLVVVVVVVVVVVLEGKKRDDDDVRDGFVADVDGSILDDNNSRWNPTRQRECDTANGL